MFSQDLRRAFLKYFKTQGHRIVPSSPVIPHDDPTILFTNAGMNQFKDVFLGNSKRDYTKAATTQKCVRVGGKHNDLDNVGHTSRHLTFFEMLGNFSFGDYFKKEAIGYAWDVTLHVFGFDPKKIWVSVFKEDEEAFQLWEKHLPAERIVRFGEAENFWSMGDTGPCGPCSELLYDRGEAYGPAKNPHEDPSGERYLEFWNLVFMQYDRSISGKMEPLPKQSIDTGAGLERVASIRMHVENVFHTDILRELIAQVEQISGKVYEGEAPFHVIADHIRSLSFAMADGVQPSNTDRGYVLRKILRRAVRYGRMLGMQKPFLADVFPRLESLMGEDFPELMHAKDRICEILTLEEEAFLRTLTRGGQLLSQVIERSQQDKKISGDDAFRLKDTYGLPIEEVLLIAKDEHLKVDMTRFQKLEEEAREKSKQAHKKEAQEFDQNFFNDFTRTHHPCKFVGYRDTACSARVIGLVVDGSFTDTVQEGQEAIILLDQTPFYAEMGGQVGDTGRIGHFQVTDCQSPFPGVIAHFGSMESGILRKNDSVQANIDVTRRKSIQNNHSATHLLHWALQQVLGSHIKQAGSVVDENRLRFDFSHHKAMSTEELRTIEELVNDKIRSDQAVQVYELPYEEAQKRSDIKQFFGDKYGEAVRVIDMDFSKELCGGTHTTRIGTIGYFRIAKESSIAAGVRRIEAVTGRAAEELVYAEESLMQEISALLKSTPSNALDKLKAFLEDHRTLSSELKVIKKEHGKQLLIDCLNKKEPIGTTMLVASIIEIDPEETHPFANELLQKLGSGIIALGIDMGERCQILIAVSPDLTELHAGHLIKEVAPLIQGGGGGKQNMAQAGGKNPAGLPKALDKVRELIATHAS
ncbi:MAG: alanine--tRNA ligase [Chlamydiae bacterium RIFCSPHIGHO2_12_FULL_44_59]|nr:MAG: alanine--tRNA ligase [Chlamydiae bacterium RIFCSPHIGHO2_01_FULL_44_39]OGN58324.1 MAG: alanine--tRNA ligase [Chlamydiae bacterium RIFCSPHIGHO2_02_FULL_45_9]OGN60353.1 MAG: alanine--tRNA ligase [Chlamydiae bacterium RIFCSPHIGHO2_12_FULL_44_59]OGN66336.1 MAG: alanine--tRNA ligase [Chlamydiae bacterium RIFCSPLOWO2_01_FULL_44_52]OGN69287.1 MAG: alanine--tRNA ligase [Chlamydiae bacterium RIFCSPLOWO2_02_FULL_45_22]OGN70227.1 MAG: alanine--tRNA ligase [Chlamydiae bacterium RIFCSPLOWO2_12_FULL_